MTSDEIKSKLRELRQKKRALSQQMERITEARASIDGIKACCFDVAILGGVATPVQERYVEHMERLREAYERILTEVFEAETTINAFLDSLEPMERNMIVDRYLLGKSWRWIQRKYNYEQRQPYRIVAKALEKISSSGEDDTK